MDESTLDMKGGPRLPVVTSAEPPQVGDRAPGQPNAAHASSTTGASPSRLPRVITRLGSDAVRARLEEANRRGRLPEIEWIARDCFAMTLPSRPLLTRLTARLSDKADDGASARDLEDLRADDGAGVALLSPARRIEFELAIHRVLWHSLIWLTVASALIGPWLTERFSPWPLLSWWWYPPLCLITALWIALRWPAMSLADADPLARERIEVIRQRLTEAD